jgi:hypothetical protein
MLAVTVASAERSFRKLTAIKNYKTNSMGQTTLNYLTISVIEHKAAANINVKELISDFANVKNRKKNF